jgi:hypothetical protein
MKIQEGRRRYKERRRERENNEEEKKKEIKGKNRKWETKWKKIQMV